jgi:RHH-type rel operon transcriptional repressor/antitoxin RelB
MPALSLPIKIEKRLDSLAPKIGRTKSYQGRETILRHIEDLEDVYLAERRLERGGLRVRLETLERDLARRG